jgi:ATP-dependent RNA helicase RhlE
MIQAVSPLSTSPSGHVPGSAFAILGLAQPLVRALVDEGYTTPTPIQSQAIPPALDGRDLLGTAQTGTGKTAAFVLPILQTLASARRNGLVRALVVTPTRELAAQIAERAGAYGKHVRGPAGETLRHTVIYGGVSQRNQELELQRKPDLLIATPGRLLDLCNQGVLRLDGVTHLVLDEADRMLDMGFIHDVRRVLAKLPTNRQTLFFSATMAPPVAQLASDMLKNPVRVSVTPEATTAETVSHGVYFVEKAEKRGLLESILREGTESVIVFTRTKHGANRLAEQLGKSGFTAAAIHGNKSQGARERALGGFREGTLRVLVATDLAARGIDVEGLSLVVNYELPNVPESYVHRIGRTGRAGASGRAISLCDFEERAYLRDIERLLRQKVPVLGGVDPAPAAAAPGRAPAVHAHGRAPVTAPPPRNAPPPRHPAPSGRPMSSPRAGASPRPAHPNPNPHARRGPSGR